MAEVISTDIKTRIGRMGIWSLELRFGDTAAAVESAAELDDLGYGALWIPGGIGGDVLGDVSRLLDATQRVTIATGILNIWKHEASEVGAWWRMLPDDHKGRVLLGLGVSHGPIIGDAWAKPLAAMGAYLDALEGEGVPAQALCLAALGPKMLQLAAERTAGAHPYLITPEHSGIARAEMGPDALLAPEQGVVLESDPATARAMAGKAVEHYRRLPNYVNSWKRLGFTDTEIEAGDDRLIDALFAWGGVDAVARRVQAHWDAGADHVCVQVVNGADKPSVEASRAAWRVIAKALI